MGDAELAYGRARDRLCIAEHAYATVESELIAARREVRETERAYLAERFPTKGAVVAHFNR